MVFEDVLLVVVVVLLVLSDLGFGLVVDFGQVVWVVDMVVELVLFYYDFVVNEVKDFVCVLVDVEFFLWGGLVFVVWVL